MTDSRPSDSGLSAGLAAGSSELRRLIANLVLIIGDIDECHGCWSCQPAAKRIRDAGWLEFAHELTGGHGRAWWREYVDEG